MTAAIPRPRPPADAHDCNACTPCPGCDGGRARLPMTISPVFHDNGWIEPRCADCNGQRYLCPTQPRTPRSLATTTFFYNQGNPTPIKSCASIGYPVPATTQLTNPQQINYDQGSGNGGNTTLPQSDPTGVFSGDTSGTFVVCVQADGTKRVDYWEGFVETEGGSAKVDSSGAIHDSGASTVVQGAHK